MAPAPLSGQGKHPGGARFATLTQDCAGAAEGAGASVGRTACVTTSCGTGKPGISDTMSCLRRVRPLSSVSAPSACASRGAAASLCSATPTAPPPAPDSQGSAMERLVRLVNVPSTRSSGSRSPAVLLLHAVVSGMLMDWRKSDVRPWAVQDGAGACDGLDAAARAEAGLGGPVGRGCGCPGPLLEAAGGGGRALPSSGCVWFAVDEKTGGDWVDDAAPPDLARCWLVSTDPEPPESRRGEADGGECGDASAPLPTRCCGCCCAALASAAAAASSPSWLHLQPSAARRPLRPKRAQHAELSAPSVASSSSHAGSRSASSALRLSSMDTRLGCRTARSSACGWRSVGISTHTSLNAGRLLHMACAHARRQALGRLESPQQRGECCPLHTGTHLDFVCAQRQQAHAREHLQRGGQRLQPHARHGPGRHVRLEVRELRQRLAQRLHRGVRQAQGVVPFG